MKKRIFSIFLALAMALSLLPGAALATANALPTEQPTQVVNVNEGNADQPEPSKSTETAAVTTPNEAAATSEGTTPYEVAVEPKVAAVAEVNGQQYKTLQAAIDAAEKAAAPGKVVEIKLMENVNTADVITFDQSGEYLLNLNNCTYTCTKSNDEIIEVLDGNLDLQISNGTIKGTGADTFGLYVFHNKTEKKGYDHVNVTLDGVTMDVIDQTLGVNGNNADNNLTIRNSTITSKTTAIYFPPISGKLTIENSEVTGVNNAIVIKGGTVEIGGNKTTIHATGKPTIGEKPPYEGDPNNPESFPKTGTAIYMEGNYKVQDGNGRPISVEIKGGNFSSDHSAAVLVKHIQDASVQKVQVSGGTFSSDVSTYLAEGYIATETSGQFVVNKPTYNDAVVDTTTQAGDTQAETGKDIQDADKNNANMSAGSVGETAESGGTSVLEDAAGDAAQTIDQHTKDTAITELVKKEIISVDENGTIQNNETVTVVTQPYFDVVATEYAVNEENAENNAISFDVTPMCQTIATTTPEKIMLEGNGKNAVVLGTPKKLEITKPIQMTLTLPAGFFGQATDVTTAYVTHIKDTGVSYAYEAKINKADDGSYTATFTNPNGFSLMRVTAAKPVATVGEKTYTSLPEALNAVKDSGGTINLLSDATLNPAQYVISGNVTITGNGKITATIPNADGSNANLIGFDIKKTGSLTLDGSGVTLEIQGTKRPVEGVPKNRDGTGISIESEGSNNGALSVQNGAILSLKELNRGMIFPSGAKDITGTGKVTVDNGKITADGIDGNFSNGGDFAVKNGGVVDVKNCGDHGLSANTVIVDKGDVSVSGVGLAGVVAQDVALKNNGTLSVTNSGKNLPKESPSAPTGKFENAVELKKDGSLTIDQSSQLSMSGNVDNSGKSVNNIAANESTVDNKGTINGDVIATAPEGKVVVTFMDGSNTVAVKQPTKSNKIGELPTVADRSNYTFLGWYNGDTKITKDSTFDKDTTVTARWSYNGGSSSGSSSSSSGRYTVKVDSGKHGDVAVSSKRADKGDTVTITVDPDKGYVLDELTVTDKNGDTVKVKSKSDSKFTFTMPASNVTVEATFIAEKEEKLPFEDVDEDFWSVKEITWAYENGYMKGNSATTFNPTGTVSRQQLWMVLARLAGERPADMAAARKWAVENGVSDGSNPGGALTRQQMVTILYRYAKLMGYNTTGSADLTIFPDYASVANYAKEAMAWSVKNEIVGGTAQGTLNPTGTANRAQFAVILYRFVK